MVRETSGRSAHSPASAIPLPELGIALHPGLAYRLSLRPAGGDERRRLWTIHARPIERVGYLVRVQPLRRLGHRSDRPPGSMSLAASRFVRAELLDPPPGGTPSTSRGKLALSEGQSEPNGAAERGATPQVAYSARYVTPSRGSDGPETEHRPDALADASAGVVPGGVPSVAQGAAADAVNRARLVSVLLRTGRPIVARDPDATPAPELVAFLLVAHRSHCATPEGCEVSRGYWAELVAIYGTAAALGAFYHAERIMETRRAQLQARAALALTPAAVRA